MDIMCPSGCQSINSSRMVLLTCFVDNLFSQLYLSLGLYLDERQTWSSLIKTSILEVMRVGFNIFFTLILETILIVSSLLRNNPTENELDQECEELSLVNDDILLVNSKVDQNLPPKRDATCEPIVDDCTKIIFQKYHCSLIAIVRSKATGRTEV